MNTTASKGNDWALYRRLLTYVTQYTGVFVLSIIGLLAYSLANVLLADLTQFLLDSLGDAPQIGIGFVSQAAHWLWPQGDKGAIEYARIAVPVAAIVLSLLRASGYFFGNYFMNIVARGVVHYLRVEVFGALIRAPKEYMDRHTQG